MCLSHFGFISTGWGFRGYDRLWFVSDVTTDLFCELHVCQLGALASEYLHCSCLVFSVAVRDSSVDVATGHWLFGLGSIPRRGEIFRALPDRQWGPPSVLYNR